MIGDTGRARGECVFCKIATKRIPSNIVYEDEKVIAFLDINPLAEGHTLIAPKNHAQDIFEIGETDLCHVISVAKRISLLMKYRQIAEGVNFMHASGKSAEQSVFHFHLHVIPRRSGDDIKWNDCWEPKVKRMSEAKLGTIAKALRRIVPEPESV